MAALISVIIPCYNVEQYIDRCIKSIVKQTIGIDNLEIVLVNDASTDHTLEKLKFWEKKYENNILVVTYEQNLRQGGARNIGIQYASADYIGFIDADDWIESDMYELLYNEVKCKQYDVVRGKFVRENHIGISALNSVARRDCEYQFNAVNGFYMGEYPDTGDNGEFGSICTGIYRKNIILENNIFFPEKILYEDNYWGAILSLYTKDCYIVDKILYHYMTNQNSTVTTENEMHHLDRLKIEMMILDKYNQEGVMEIREFLPQIERNFIQRYYLGTVFILFTRFTYVPTEIINYIIRTVQKLWPNWKENKYLSQLDLLNRQLLELLNLNRDLTDDELEKIKELYLQAWIEKYDI